MKYAHVDESNNILGWYTLDIHKNIPFPNIEVTDEIWSESLRIGANCIDNGKFTYKDTSSKADKDKINEDIEWNDYLKSETEAKKIAWKLAGKPKYSN